MIDAIDLDRGYEGISSFNQPAQNPLDAKASELSLQTIRCHESNAKLAGNWSLAEKPDPRIGMIAQPIQVKAAPKPLFAAIPAIPYPFVPTDNTDAAIINRIYKLQKESFDLKIEEEDLRRSGRSAFMWSAICGLLLGIVMVIPGLLIGWAIRDLAFTPKADQARDRARAVDMEIDQLILLLNQRKVYLPPEPTQPYPRSTTV
ncbi:MAG: hypothetical protein JSS32_08215 [Verrucomicrobia bacterium]|nr:hypothetical protein [Verrucomicrobiota bacterium]